MAYRTENHGHIESHLHVTTGCMFLNMVPYTISGNMKYSFEPKNNGCDLPQNEREKETTGMWCFGSTVHLCHDSTTNGHRIKSTEKSQSTLWACIFRILVAHIFDTIKLLRWGRRAAGGSSNDGDRIPWFRMTKTVEIARHTEHITLCSIQHIYTHSQQAWSLQQQQQR